MKDNVIVNTKYGIGKVIQREGTTGILSKRYLVKLSNPGNFADLQESAGGIYMFEHELTEIKVQPKVHKDRGRNWGG